MRRVSAFAVFLLAGLAAPAAGATPALVEASADRVDVEVFTTLRRPVVAVGEAAILDVELLAVATPAEETALADALDALTLASGLDEARRPWTTLRRTGEVVEIRRRFWLRAAAPGAYAVGGLVLRLPGEVGPRRLPAREVLAYDPAAAAEASRHVVEVRVERRVGERRFSRTGSAFLVAPDALVTAYHVVSGARRVTVSLPDGSTVRTGRAWRLDAEADLAVLHVDADRVRRAGLRPLALAPPNAPADAAPEVVFTAGWSEGEQRRTAAARFPSLAVDGAAVGLSANSVRPGDSGGPLLDAHGRVVGVVTSGRSTEGEADLLRQEVCIAAALAPALTGWSERPRSLRAAAPRTPAARAFAAAERLLAAPPPDPSALVHTLVGAADGDAFVQFLAGTVLEGLGDATRAAHAFGDAHAAGYFPATYALAHHHLRTGDAAAAEALFAQVGRTRAYAHLGALGRARALVVLRRYAEAEAEIDRVLGHDARFGPALYLLGLVRLSQGREDAARALVVCLAPRPAWADALRLPIERPELRPAALAPLPLVALR